MTVACNAMSRNLHCAGAAFFLPLVTLVAQIDLWEYLRPFAWVLFYPTVFVAALVGGLWGGIGATFFSALLVGLVFIPSHFAEAAFGNAAFFVSTTTFLASGTLLSFANHRLRRLAEKAGALIGEHRFRALFDAASDGIVCLDAEGRYLEANAAFCRMTGYSRSQLLTMRAYEVVPASEHARLDALLANVSAHSGQAGEWLVQREDGSCQPVEATVQHLANGTWMAVIRDIGERTRNEARVHAAAELNQAILDSVISQVAVLDRSGIIIAVNEAWLEFARGHCSSDQQLARTGLGTNFLDVCRPELQGDSWVYTGVLEVLHGRSDYFHCECLCETPQAPMWFAMNVTPLASPEGGAVVSYLDITDIKRAQDTEHRANVELKTLAVKQLVFQEEERRTLSRELHDHVSQDLAALQLALDDCSRHTKSLPKVQATLLEANGITNSILETTRDISRRLRPPLLDDLGLAAALRWHIDKIPRTQGVSIGLHEDIGSARFPADIELACFRIAQEAISNALRHARAGQIMVRIQRQDAGMSLTVHDDGQGFESEQAIEHSRKLNSLGLLGMRERVAGVGGEFHIESSPGAGTAISATFKVPFTLQ